MSQPVLSSTFYSLWWVLHDAHSIYKQHNSAKNFSLCDIQVLVKNSKKKKKNGSKWIRFWSQFFCSHMPVILIKLSLINFIYQTQRLRYKQLKLVNTLHEFSHLSRKRKSNNKPVRYLLLCFIFQFILHLVFPQKSSCLSV